MRKMWMAALGGAGVLVAGAAQAATVTINTTVDLANVTVSPGEYEATPSAFAPLDFTLGAGDTLDFTMSLLAGQSITVQKFQGVDAIFGPMNTADPVISNGAMLELLSGGSVVASATSSSVNGNLLAAIFLASDLSSIPTGLTFDAIHVVTGISTMATPREFTTADVGVIDLGNPQQQGIPEPAVWTLMIGGFGLAGAALRRHRLLAA